MKTHKCASTTVQNILMRYGLEQDLNFVLPLTGHYLGKTKSFDRYEKFLLKPDFVHLIFTKSKVHAKRNSLGQGWPHLQYILSAYKMESIWGKITHTG